MSKDDTLHSTKGFSWVETIPGEQWNMSGCPDGETSTPRIKKSSRNNDGSYSYFCFRNAKAIAITRSLEEAQKICAAKKPPPVKPDEVIKYVDEHPGEVPWFLKLTQEERRAVRAQYPYAAPPAAKVAAAEKVPEEVPPKPKAEAKPKRESDDQKLERLIPSDDDGGIPQKGKLVRLREGNPKKAGSAPYKRWELLFEHCAKGSTVGQFIKAGGNPETMKNAILQKYVEVK